SDHAFEQPCIKRPARPIVEPAPTRAIAGVGNSGRLAFCCDSTSSWEPWFSEDYSGALLWRAVTCALDRQPGAKSRPELLCSQRQRRLRLHRLRAQWLQAQQRQRRAASPRQDIGTLLLRRLDQQHLRQLKFNDTHLKRADTLRLLGPRYAGRIVIDIGGEQL